MERCNRFTFTQSNPSQGGLVKEIHLPKDLSLVSAKIVVRKAFGVNSLASVNLYAGDQELKSIADTTTIYDLINSLGGESIEIRITQSDAYNILKIIYEKTKKGISLSSIEESLWDKGACDMGGEEKISEIEKIKIKFKSKKDTPERKLMEKFYEIIIFNHKTKIDTKSTFERYIGKYISEKAIEKGYDKSNFNNWVFLKSSFESIIEKYEFLFRYSNMFTENDRKLLLEAIKIYNNYVKEIKKINKIPQHILNEYILVKTIQKVYFKEFKKYLSFRKLAFEITRSYSSFDHHFFHQKDDYIFEAFLIFQIEYWAKKNLSKKNLKEIQNKIVDWRNKNEDNSIYAIHNTPFRNIIYSILVLYYSVYDKFISVWQLDEMLKERFSNTFPNMFCAERIKPKYEKMNFLPKTDKINLLKIFVKEIFQSKPSEETQLLIKLIEDFNKIPRKNRLLSRHSEYQFIIKPYQLKTLIDITKGLDVVDSVLFSDKELTKNANKGGVTIHHIYIDEDPITEFIFEISSHEVGYKIKLVPLKYFESHRKVHKGTNLFKEIATILAEARIRHLYELDKNVYDKKISKENYINIFKEKFKDEKVFISKYGRKVSIWNSFEDGKIKELTNDIIEKFVDRWIDAKKISEKQWYNNHYKEFYRVKYLPFIKQLKEYAKESLKNPVDKSVYEWFLSYYLPNEIFP